ncbi:MAG: ribonuclease Z [Bacteroidales bacterium]|nr:ribonuclease Z [Bacteroidales bacterium]MDZ4205139.1 ribonuclease Z [Bacteroidales bacterium]
MIFSVTILGSNSATPLIERHPTAQVVNHLHRLFLVDCGEGTQVQLARYKTKIQRISHIFISHLHGDHYFGLIGLIMTYHLFGRQTPLHIYANHELEQIIHLQLKASMSSLVYPLVFHAIDANAHQVIYSDNYLDVSTIPMNHRVPTCGFLFKEKLRDQNLREGVLRELGIPYDAVPSIKHGGGYLTSTGKFYENAELAYPPLPVRSFAYCSDTAIYEPIAAIIKNADLLYHEATFMHDRVETAREKYHSTTIDAATLAKESGAKKLVIGHYSARYDDLQPLLMEARSVFPESYLATEGAVFNVVD